MFPFCDLFVSGTVRLPVWGQRSHASSSEREVEKTKEEAEAFPAYLGPIPVPDHFDHLEPWQTEMSTSTVSAQQSPGVDTAAATANA